jgi:hypothetical protein
MPKFNEGDTLKVGEVEALMEVANVAGNIPKFAASGQLEDSLIVASKLAKVAIQNDAAEISAAGAVPTSGVAIVKGGTGIAGLTLAAPTPGCRCTIVLATLTSGTVVVTCGAGVTVGDTLAASTTIMTLDAAAEAIVLVYGAANKWLIVSNVGAVALS